MLVVHLHKSVVKTARTFPPPKVNARRVNRRFGVHKLYTTCAQAVHRAKVNEIWLILGIETIRVASAVVGCVHNMLPTLNVKTDIGCQARLIDVSAKRTG